MWAPSLAKLILTKNFTKLSYKERRNIFHFLALQHIRTPCDNQSIVEVYNAIARKSLEVYGELSSLKVVETEEDQTGTIFKYYLW